MTIAERRAKVAELTKAGKTERVIAAELGVSRTTVWTDKHVAAAAREELRSIAMEPGFALGYPVHYFDASNGSCRAAVVTETFGPEGAPNTGANLAVWNHDGSPFTRTSVPVDRHPNVEASANSLHVASDCPWGR